MQLHKPQCSKATHTRTRTSQTQVESRAVILWKQVELFQTRTIGSLHWGSGGGPHLEPSSLPFLSNSVETLRCVRQEHKENKIDVDCTFFYCSYFNFNKMWQRCETTTENKRKQKYQEVKDSASHQEKTVKSEDELNVMKDGWWN